MINYRNHIQPLWALPRLMLDGERRTCSRTTPARPATARSTPPERVRVPAGQLDLSGGPSPDEADHLVSYRELLFADNEQEVNMGALQDSLVPGPSDPVTGHADAGAGAA